MKLAVIGVATGLVLAFAAMPVVAADFSGSFTTTYHNSDPGLVVDADPSAGNLNFTLGQGDSTTIDLFDLYTTEKSVNVGEDTTPEPISVSFTFTQPSPGFGGAVDGTTQGNSVLFGLIQNGSVTWSNGGDQTFAFGNGGELDVHLNDATFDQSLFGLKGGESKGADIQGTFTLAKAPTISAAPEPASWALILGGVGLLGGVLRITQARRREDLAERGLA